MDSQRRDSPLESPLVWKGGGNRMTADLPPDQRLPDQKLMCPANWKSRDPGVPETLLICPKFPALNVDAGLEKVTLFQTLMQSTSKTNVPMSLGRLKLLR